MKNKYGIIMLLITAILWGAGFVAQYIGGEHLESFSFTSLRCLVGAIFILLTIIVDNIKKYKKICFFAVYENKKDVLKISFLCGFFLFVAMTLQQIGVMMTTTAKAGFISSMTVVCCPLILMLFGKKIKKVTWLFIISAVIGIAMLNINENIKIGFGDFICFISTIFFSIDILLISKLGHKIDSLKFSFFRFIEVTILSAIIALLFENIKIDNIILAKNAILFSGIFVIGMAYTMQIIGEKHVEPIIATMIMSLEGMFATIFGFFILGQNLNFLQVIGCVVITVSIILVQLTSSEMFVEV